MIHEIYFDKGVLALAPLAGFTDLPFRSVVKKFGADLTFSEMISASEGNNHVLKSIYYDVILPSNGAKDHIVTSAVEHQLFAGQG